MLKQVFCFYFNLRHIFGSPSVPTHFPFVCLQNVSITETEIEDIIQYVITNKAVGEDLISHLVL